MTHLEQNLPGLQSWLLLQLKYGVERGIELAGPAAPSRLHSLPPGLPVGRPIYLSRFGSFSALGTGPPLSRRLVIAY